MDRACRKTTARCERRKWPREEHETVSISTLTFPMPPLTRLQDPSAKKKVEEEEEGVEGEEEKKD